MKHVSKPLFATLMLLLALNSSFGQVTTHTIELRLDPVADTLIDPRDREVHRGDTVIWIKAENIKSFNIIGRGHPFTTGLPWHHRDLKWIKKDINRNASDGGWKYTIKYKTKNPSRKRYLDPKITVMPAPLIGE